MRAERFPGADDPHRYDDMLHLPHPVSASHPPMSCCNRAAQFAPFAALTGYDAEVEEAGRMTERRIELGEGEQAALDAKLQALRAQLGRLPGKQARRSAPAGSSGFALPEVSVTHFVPDARKVGGAYVLTGGAVRRIDPQQQALVMADGRTIPFMDIIALEIVEPDDTSGGGRPGR